LDPKRTSKRLVLNRETVRVLADAEMQNAAGGRAVSLNGCWTPVIWTIPVGQCLSRDVYPCP